MTCIRVFTTCFWCTTSSNVRRGWGGGGDHICPCHQSSTLISPRLGWKLPEQGDISAGGGSSHQGEIRAGGGGLPDQGEIRAGGVRLPDQGEITGDGGPPDQGEIRAEGGGLPDQGDITGGGGLPEIRVMRSLEVVRISSKCG